MLLFNYGSLDAVGTLVSRGGGIFFHSKGTWGCAVRKCILLELLLQPSFLAILFDLSLAKGMLIGNFGQRNIKLW